LKERLYTTLEMPTL